MKEVKFYESTERNYYVNNMGQCRSVSKKTGVCKILAGTVNSNGYLVIGTGDGVIYVHRIIAESFIPNPDNMPVINHRNGDKRDNSIGNLEWVTQQDNVKHAWETGLIEVTDRWRDSASENGKKNRKLTMKDAEDMRDLFYNKGITQKEIREMYKLSQSTISKIINYKRYIS